MESKRKFIEDFRNGTKLATLIKKYKISREEGKKILNEASIDIEREGSGRLSREDIALVKKMIRAGNSDEDIARKIGKTIKAVKKVRQNTFVSTDITDEDKQYDRIVAELKQKSIWPLLKQQFNAKELNFFEEDWAKFMIQFREDVTPTEEEQLREFITLTIFLDRAIIDRKRCVDDLARYIKEIEEILKKEPEDRNQERLQWLEDMKVSMELAQKSNTNEIKSLMEKREKTLGSLKGDRTARIQRVDDSKSSWMGVVRYLEDEKNREREGLEAQIMRHAVEEQFKKLAVPHTYLDGQEDLPLLSPETLEIYDAQKASEEISCSVDGE